MFIWSAAVSVSGQLQYTAGPEFDELWRADIFRWLNICKQNWTTGFSSVDIGFGFDIMVVLTELA